VRSLFGCGQGIHEEINSTNPATFMKTALLRGMISIAVLAACAAPAELIVYKGTAPITYIGQDHTLLLNFKMFLVVDHDTANVAELWM
jgi:hypothetical protein